MNDTTAADLWDLPPAERTILKPPGGWVEHGYYIVEASFNVHNPIHRYIYFVGFLNGQKDEDGQRLPGGYNEVLKVEGGHNSIEYLWYLRPIHFIGVDNMIGGPTPADGKFNLLAQEEQSDG